MKNYYYKRYGLTIVDVEKMAELQEHRCAICGTHVEDLKVKQLFVDHDHITGEVRQMLCFGCNYGIGLLNENPTIIQSAISYLQHYGSI